MRAERATTLRMHALIVVVVNRNPQIVSNQNRFRWLEGRRGLLKIASCKLVLEVWWVSLLSWLLLACLIVSTMPPEGMKAVSAFAYATDQVKGVFVLLH